MNLIEHNIALFLSNGSCAGEPPYSAWTQRESRSDRGYPHVRVALPLCSRLIRNGHSFLQPDSNLNHIYSCCYWSMHLNICWYVMDVSIANHPLNAQMEAERTGWGCSGCKVSEAEKNCNRPWSVLCASESSAHENLLVFWTTRLLWLLNCIVTTAEILAYDPAVMQTLQEVHELCQRCSDWLCNVVLTHSFSA